MEWKTLNIDWQTPKNLKMNFIATVICIIIILSPFPYLIIILKSINLKILTLIIFILLIIHQISTWIASEYRRMNYTPNKIRWNKEGIEIVNPFGKIKRISWSWIVYIDKKVQKSLLGRKKGSVYQVHLFIPEDKNHNILARKILYYRLGYMFWVDEEIGEELFEYWIKNVKHIEDVKVSPAVVYLP